MTTAASTTGPSSRRALRGEVSVLRRQVNRPRIGPEERMVLSLLQRLWAAREGLSLPGHAGHAPPMASGACPSEVDPTSSGQPEAEDPARDPAPRVAVGKGESALGLPAHPRRAQEAGHRDLGVEYPTDHLPEARSGPKRDAWCQFMRNQAASIIACDLFTVGTIRLKTLHVLFFIDLHMRNVLIGGVTDGATNLTWCTQIARNPSEAREFRDIPLQFLVHDRDNRSGPTFDEVFKAEGIRILRTPWRAPRANAYAERFVRTVRNECLDRVFILNECHLRSVLTTYVDHYNRERPHRGLDLLPPEGPPNIHALSPTRDNIGRRDRLGGLIHEYYREAA